MQPEYIKIPLTKGYEAIIDAEDADRVLAFNWYASVANTRKDGTRVVYAARKPRGGIVYLHRFIISAPDDLRVDHGNRDSLDCRKSNLRWATRSQNAANSIRPRVLSPYRGLHWHGKQGKWCVLITCDGDKRYLGFYSDPVEAAIAYDNAAIEYFGEFAVLNFPREGSND